MSSQDTNENVIVFLLQWENLVLNCF